jgi:hypothetical protein
MFNRTGPIKILNKQQPPPNQEEPLNVTDIVDLDQDFKRRNVQHLGYNLGGLVQSEPQKPRKSSS